MSTERFSERIEQLIGELGSAAALARAAGVSASVVAKWRHGTSEPTRSNLLSIANATGSDIAWLVAGVGSRRPGQQASRAPALDEQRLKDAIELAEWALEQRDRVMKPPQKADFVVAIYDFLAGDESAQGAPPEQRDQRRERVLRLVSSAM